MMLKLTARSGKPIWVAPGNLATFIEKEDKESGSYTEIDLFSGTIEVSESPAVIQMLLAQLDVRYEMMQTYKYNEDDLIAAAERILGDPVQRVTQSKAPAIKVLPPVGD